MKDGTSQTETQTPELKKRTQSPGRSRPNFDKFLAQPKIETPVNQRRDLERRSRSMSPKKKVDTSRRSKYCVDVVVTIPDVAAKNIKKPKKLKKPTQPEVVEKPAWK